MNLQGKRALVIGLGESGLAMVRWLNRQGASVRVADSREQPPTVDKLRAAVPAAELVAGAFVSTSTKCCVSCLIPGIINLRVHQDCKN